MPIQKIIGLIIFISASLNFFIRTIQITRANHQQKFAKEARHSFTCKGCGETYELDGPETKKKLLWAITIQSHTLQKTKTTYYFTCPKCEKHCGQIKQYDAHTLKSFGAFQLMLGPDQKPLIIPWLTKGVLVSVIGMILGVVISKL